MRGQISLDIILAIAIGFIAVSSMGIVGNEITQMQKEASVGQQLDSIGISLSQFISNSAILDDADSATLTFDIPEIIVIGETGTQQCEIEIDASGDLEISYELVEVATGTITLVSRTFSFVDPTPAMTISPDLSSGNEAKCGGTLTITT